MQKSSMGEPRERLTPAAWVALVARDERKALAQLRVGRGNRQSLLDYYDAANEDHDGRLPHEPGYDGAYVREVRALKAITPKRDAEAAVIQLVLRFAEAA